MTETMAKIPIFMVITLPKIKSSIMIHFQVLWDESILVHLIFLEKVWYPNRYLTLIGRIISLL